jgi:nucleoside-diphosphate-sugar epimerase
MARILVTGANGSIGYAVTEALLTRGDEVLATDVDLSPRLRDLAERQRALTFVTISQGAG